MYPAYPKIMQDKIIAFVVKNHFPLQNKITLISRHHGKITGYLNNNAHVKNISHGSIIACSITELKNNYLLIESPDTVIAFMPESQAAINWLHHLLELCRYFIAEKSPNDQIFSWVVNFVALLHAAQLKNRPSFSTIQKIYILYFFELAGLTHRPLNEKHYTLIEKINMLITANDFTALNLLTYKESDSQTLTHSIVKTLQEHPCFIHFKTIPFVYSS